ncbi:MULTISPECIES: hypothetical protein [Rhodococcus]|uniref:Uncharacterized protein n=1 Tax=Rhodococcus koreensis TaxID=99653 RepID=A0A1H5F573_9NOCA|nr:hypothetical protein [Rhodococcus koreensis]SED98597.1 hypothetical protein SAMN04490239_9500 [Rhodococcus koreensis]
MSSNRKISAITGLVHAQSRQLEAETGKARIELDTRRFDDAVAQRDRYLPIIEQVRERHAARVFDYQRVLQAEKQFTFESRPRGTGT